MKTKTKPRTTELVQVIGELAKARQQLARQAEQHYAVEVMHQPLFLQICLRSNKVRSRGCHNL